HDNAGLKSATLHALAAAVTLGGEVQVLVAGHNADGAAAAAAKLPGVAKVIQADAPEYAHDLAENLGPLVAELAKGASHVLAAATTYGKNVLPRAAALLDVQQISDIIAIEGTDTFVRPIYAGNALATVKSADPVKIVTVRTTAFEAGPAEGGA